MVMAKVLGVGFRTYVRYEGGERNAPPSTLIQMAKLGSVSLDRLITTNLTDKELESPDTTSPPDILKNPQIISGSLASGRLNLKGFRNEIYVCVDEKESEALGKFRDMSQNEKDKFILIGKKMIKSKKRHLGMKNLQPHNKF